MWLLYISVMLGFMFPLSASEGKQEAELTIYLPNLDCKDGSVMIAIYAPADNFLSDEASTTLRIPCDEVNEKKVSLKLTIGTAYAVAVYHDKNDNLQLDKNFFRYPSEPFGFSNNPGILTGAPSFDDTKFAFDQEMKLTIRLK